MVIFGRALVFNIVYHLLAWILTINRNMHSHLLVWQVDVDLCRHQLNTALNLNERKVVAMRTAMLPLLKTSRDEEK